MNKRDAFVAILKTLIAGWKFEQGQLSNSNSEEFLRLQVLIAKTTVFLRDEFGEK